MPASSLDGVKQNRVLSRSNLIDQMPQLRD